LKIGNVHGFNLELASSTKLEGKNITVSRIAQKPKDGHIFTAPVGRFRGNQFGLYDMLGNAREWCSDWYDEDYYIKSPLEDPSGPDTGAVRAVRGGGWEDDPVRCRSSYRACTGPADCYGSIGFRVVMDVERYPVREAAGTPAVATKPVDDLPAEPRAGEVFTNTQGIKLALVPAGEFTMGSDASLADLQRGFGKLPDFLPPELVAGEGPISRALG
jgi:formylglycine-generating enzyme required for sulfatase activity